MSRATFLRNEQIVERRVVELNHWLNDQIHTLIKELIPEGQESQVELTPAVKRRLNYEIHLIIEEYQKRLHVLLRQGISMAAVVALQGEQRSLKAHLGPYYARARPHLEALGERMMQDG